MMGTSQIPVVANGSWTSFNRTSSAPAAKVETPLIYRYRSRSGGRNALKEFGMRLITRKNSLIQEIGEIADGSLDVGSIRFKPYLIFEVIGKIP